MFTEGTRLGNAASEGQMERNVEDRQPVAFLIDVAGMDERSQSIDDLDSLEQSGRDSTTLSIVTVDLSTLPTLHAPTYRAQRRALDISLNPRSLRDCPYGM